MTITPAQNHAPFYHLHIQSHFSLMWGTAALSHLADRLKQDGQTVFPLTDRNGVFGLVQHLKVCQREGLRPVMGCELVCESSFDDTFDRQYHPTNVTSARSIDQTLCLVKSHTGYQNLCMILTDMSFHPERRLYELLENRHEGLIFITQTDDVLSMAEAGAEVYIDLSPGRMEKASHLHAVWKLPLAATVHASLLDREDWKRHLILRAIETNSTLSQRNHFWHAGKNDFLCSRAEASARMSAFPQALAITGHILERCAYAPTIGPLIFPSKSHRKDAETLRVKAYHGARRRLGKLTKKACTRLEFELNLIRKKGFESPFLIAADVVQHFPITCGRGSAAASLIAYCLNITHVNPLEHNLFFERFLNEGRVDPPDIDIDFPWDERDRVRDYLWEKYGHNHIAMVANHNHLQIKGCLREVAKVFGFGPTEITHFTRQLHLLKKGQREPRLTPTWKHVLHWARKLEGTPRCLSVHCGGVIITPEPLSHYAPVYDMPIGYPTLPWDKDDVENFGFVKLDFLGNRSLAVIRDTLAHVSRDHDVPAYDQLNPLEDAHTQTLIASGRTVGCFYIESPATRQLLQKTRHGDYETLVAISSIIRPAANKVTEQWVQRHRHMKQEGNQPNWPSIHPVLEEVLCETHGLMVYQEDVTRIAMELADFDAFKGNQLRKIISKKAPEKLAVLKDEFFRGCTKKGLTSSQIQVIWSMIESFAGYSFCKPHSASYALVSFKSAYLKLRFPEYFLAAVLSNYGGFYSTYAYLSYARRLGVRIQLPEINHSQKAFSASHRRIIIGFAQIKNLKEESIRQIIEERKILNFANLNDFIDRISLPARDLRQLILIGAFDSIEPNRTRSSLILQSLCRQSEGQNRILEPFRPTAQNTPELPGFSESQIDAIETSILGFPVSRTPLDPFGVLTHSTSHIKAEDISSFTGRKVTLFGTLISAKTVRTKEHESMSFLTFEDETDIFECVAFPEVYRQFAALFEYRHSYMLYGQVEDQKGALSIHLIRVEILKAELIAPTSP